MAMMTDLAEGLLQPDIILPVQFAGALRRQAPRLTGEVQLVMAVLEDAVNCFQKYLYAKNNRERRLFRDAEEWIMTGRRRVRSGGLEEPSLSFEYVCEVLGLDESCVRQGLQRWRERQLEGRQIQCCKAAHRSRPRRVPSAQTSVGAHAA
jgi:hypothetical protein